MLGDFMICNSLEASYIIKKDNQFSKDDTIYPIFEFDYVGPKLDANNEFNLNILKLFDN